MGLADGQAWEREFGVPTPSRNGTEGRVYGGDPGLIHISDGKRDAAGSRLAWALDQLMRANAVNRTKEEQAYQPLCPGCYMVAGFDMMVHLADRNGQSRRELARAMRDAFQRLLDDPDSGTIEFIHIQLDPCDG